MAQKESKARKTIRKLIKKSSSKLLGRQSLQKFLLGNIFFSDFMDIVFYYIFLQPDLKTIANISTRDFYERLKFVWDLWPARLDNTVLNDIYLEWYSDSKDVMGSAELYATLSPGFRQKDNLLEFFYFPTGIISFCNTGNWPLYRKEIIKKKTFPKFRQPENYAKLEVIFDFADDLCERLRKIAANKKEQNDAIA